MTAENKNMPVKIIWGRDKDGNARFQGTRVYTPSGCEIPHIGAMSIKRGGPDDFVIATLEMRADLDDMTCLSETEWVHQDGSPAPLSERQPDGYVWIEGKKCPFELNGIHDIEVRTHTIPMKGTVE